MTSKNGSAWRTWRERPDAIDLLCKRIESGESYRGIARSFGIDDSTLREWIGQDAPRSARASASRRLAAAAYDELALEGLENAGDPFELAKAREAAQHLRWRASKVNPASYGDRTVLAGDPDAPLIVATQAQRDAAVKAAQS